MAAALAACSAAETRDNGDCGDGEVTGGEQCDDGNAVGGDGCSAICRIEAAVSCGDGAVAASEGCDDGNSLPGDGCNASCGVEPGYTCTGAPSVCTNDGTNAGGGTCSAPKVLTLAANANMELEGTGTGDTSTGTDQVMAGDCDGAESGAGPDHIWKFTLAETRDVIIEVEDTTVFDAAVRVLAAPCDITTEITDFVGDDGCSDSVYAGEPEYLGYSALPAGTYYIVIDGYEAVDKGAYSFKVTAVATTCGDGVIDLLESCDDGGSAASDGCSAQCAIEDGYVCDGEPSVCSNNPSSAVPPAMGDLVLNEFMAADNASDTNCDGVTTGTGDEFIELVNVSTKTLDLTGVTVADSVVMRHTFGAVELAPGEAVVVWNAGTPNCTGVDTFEVASSGQLGLNDTGDTIKVDLGTTSLISVTYPTQTTNVSSNLSPDLTGTSYVLHNMMNMAMAYSPGMRSDGSAF